MSEKDADIFMPILQVSAHSKEEALKKAIEKFKVPASGIFNPIPDAIRIYNLGSMV